jgi:hypothetical protein
MRCVVRRVMDALYKGQEQAGIFVRADMQTYADAMKTAADKFEEYHDATYFGAGSLRRLSNTNKWVWSAGPGVQGTTLQAEGQPCTPHSICLIALVTSW